MTMEGGLGWPKLSSRRYGYVVDESGSHIYDAVNKQNLTQSEVLLLLNKGEQRRITESRDSLRRDFSSKLLDSKENFSNPNK